MCARTCSCSQDVNSWPGCLALLGPLTSTLEAETTHSSSIPPVLFGGTGGGARQDGERESEPFVLRQQQSGLQCEKHRACVCVCACSWIAVLTAALWLEQERDELGRATSHPTSLLTTPAQSKVANSVLTEATNGCRSVRRLFLLLPHYDTSGWNVIQLVEPYISTFFLWAEHTHTHTRTHLFVIQKSGQKPKFNTVTQ